MLYEQVKYRGKKIYKNTKQQQASRSKAKWSMLTSNKVTWHGQRGMQWNQLIQNIKALMQSALYPKMLFIHLGCKDLVSTPLRKLTKQA